MALADFAAGLQRSLGHLVDALGDPRRQHRSAAALIVIYVLLWWAYAVVAKSSQGIHFDMAEQYAWSLHPAFGYAKHPPFAAWLLTAWFAVFPRADWAFYLIAIAIVGVGLWFIWLIIARMVEGGEKRAMALMFLTFAPIFNFQPLKYNPNAVLIPVWAAACWLFLRSLQERTLVWGVLAGVGAGIAMLTKYWSIFLIVAMIVAALADPRRRLYLRSPAPWAAIVAGTIVLAPNIASLWTYDFQPFAYATGVHAARTVIGALNTAFGYLSGVFYLAGSFVALALAARPDAKAWRDMLWPHETERRLMATVTLVALLLPVAVALAMEVEVRPLWTMPCWAMLPAMLLSAPRVTVTRRAATTVVAVAYGIAVLMLAVSPVVALVVFKQGVAHSAIYEKEIAHTVDRLWTYGRPLRYVTGSEDLAWACTFYCADRPDAVPGLSFQQAPWIDRADMMRRGYVALCETEDWRCINAMHAFAGADAVERTETLVSHAFGTSSPPRQFTFLLSPPR